MFYGRTRPSEIMNTDLRIPPATRQKYMLFRLFHALKYIGSGQKPSAHKCSLRAACFSPEYARFCRSRFHK